MNQLRVHVGIFALILAVVGGVVLYQSAKASGSTDVVKDVAVNCGPASRAVIRQATGQSLVAVDCVAADSLATMSSPVQTWPDGLQTVSATGYGPMVMPAVYTTPAPARVVAAEPAPRTRSVSQTRTTATRTVERRPTWQKRALVIGGSAGAGAGIGALIGGKKGALIGAAIGGGGAAVVDQVKH